MSHRRTYTHSQHSYVVSIDAGSFANIEIVVGGYQRGGVWSPPPRASTTTTREDHGYGYGASAFPALFRAAPRRLTAIYAPLRHSRVFYPTSPSSKKIDNITDNSALTIIFKALTVCCPSAITPAAHFNCALLLFDNGCAEQAHIRAGTTEAAALG